MQGKRRGTINTLSVESRINLELHPQILLFSLSAFFQAPRGTLSLLKLLLLWVQLKAPKIGTLSGPIPSIILYKKSYNPMSKEM